MCEALYIPTACVVLRRLSPIFDAPHRIRTAPSIGWALIPFLRLFRLLLVDGDVGDGVPRIVNPDEQEQESRGADAEQRRGGIALQEDRSHHDPGIREK